MCEQENKAFETRPISTFKDYNFFIDEYQRGYKWTAQQVLDLLNDIDGYDKNKEAFYCLQPLAVKALGQINTNKHFPEDPSEKCFEVIDGQQRLTTVFLILTFLKKKLYKIQYQTRKESAKFLLDIQSQTDNRGITYDEGADLTAINKAIIEQWKDYVNKESDYDNIDNYHFFGAYLTIKAWFHDKTDDYKDTFKNKLLEETRFIWYLDESKDDPKAVFRNLNSGKIPLTNAELIKALFINSFTNGNKEVLELQQNSFAMEWDTIEQTLQNDDFWFFINNSTDKTRYQTRIDFIFELITKKPKKSKDALYSYRKYASLEEPLNWKKVKNYFLKLKEWYERPLWYHLIGYIIDRKISTIHELIDKSNLVKNNGGLSKSDFERELYAIIRNRFSETDEDGSLLYDLDLISYDESHQRVKDVLLLFNIQHYIKNVKGVRFPFKEFKYTKWSLEHIHAQNSDDIETYKELDALVRDVLAIYVEMKVKYRTTNEASEKDVLNEKLIEFEKKIKKKLDVLKKSCDKASNQNTLINDSDRKILEEVMPYVKEFLEMHNLSNMALLDQPTNSGMGKQPFPKKRDYLVEIDQKSWTIEGKDNPEKERPYIPPATLNVFMKYYTKGAKQYELWGYQDRKDYLNEIKKSLKPFFEKDGGQS